MHAIPMQEETIIFRTMRLAFRRANVGDVGDDGFGGWVCEFYRLSRFRT